MSTVDKFVPKVYLEFLLLDPGEIDSKVETSKTYKSKIFLVNILILGSVNNTEAYPRKHFQFKSLGIFKYTYK